MMNNGSLRGSGAEGTPIPKQAGKDCTGSGFALLSKYRPAVMGFAALWILCFHEWSFLTGDAGILSLAERYIKQIGFCGVDIFLFLSGIGLTFSIGKCRVLEFYYRRIKRVFLPFLIIGILRCATENWGMAEFLKNIFCIHFYTKSMYSFLWFVPAILTFYLLFPLYYKLFSGASDKLLFTVGVCEIWLILSLFLNGRMRYDLYGFTNRIPIFLIGIYAGWLSQHKKTGFTKTTWLTISCTFVLGAYLAYLSNFRQLALIVPISNCCIPNMLIAMSLPFLMAKLLDMLCRFKQLGCVGMGLNKLLAFYGIFTLELYCVQEWLGGLILPRAAAHGALFCNLTVLLTCTAAGLLLFFIGTRFWKLVDRSIRRIKNQ